MLNFFATPMVNIVLPQVILDYVLDILLLKQITIPVFLCLQKTAIF